MSLCINPKCPNAQNPDNILFCQTCGSELLLEGRYRVASILGGDSFGKTFAVSDARSNTTKVLKVLPPVSSTIAPNFGASPLVAQVSSSPGKKTNVALMIGLGCFLPLIGLFQLRAAIALPSLLNQANKAKQSEARNYIGTMNRAQQAYFLENNKFASTIAELQLGLKSETQNYSYSVNVINPKRSVRLTAKAKNSGIKSYTGAVFVQNSKEYFTIAGICETNAPSQKPPSMPQFVKGIIQCPAGSQSLAR